MKRTLTALTVAATMFASSASAFDREDLQKLKDTIQCERCDLMGADLSDANLRWARLWAADLRQADLSGALLDNAELRIANLSGANLPGARLNGADLRSANLSGADLIMTYMNDAILCNTTMPNGSVIYNGC